MNDVNIFFPIMIYVLSSILLIVLIALSLKLIHTLTKVDRVIDDIEKFAEFREKWNDNRSSMNDICKRAENLADWLKKQHYVL